jgi:hypothetical protein
LLKKIQALKKEKETLAHHYEQEEECLTNDLSRKLNQVSTCWLWIGRYIDICFVEISWVNWKKSAVKHFKYYRLTFMICPEHYFHLRKGG